ncbi:MAG: amidotransferase 1, exosortase A system-associated [Sulfurimicrobium sp.]|nr:amidotransferase 1, exosortase A system-associated [Sulfurimicrobium sp.]MDP1703620.1 amidotransferase 1, exosortase A system-associated [Sulfurimicrobium sp.]MDP2198614.1 amidotransferase 1, exosortase A system-associated [Sulfurimicrobium sp.]
MCGIVGIFNLKDKREIDQQVLARMNQTQFHRGPDEGGLHAEPGIGLGHRRLSIIDLSSGHQPLFNEDGSVVVVFNGEIYNYVDLMPELQRLGHTFRTHCDTEVIVHAWEEWGEACVERFRGMFAFALWDRNKETLFLARDRLGIKPLYYGTLPDGTFLFGSELKSLLVYPDFPRVIDDCAVEEYFAYGYVPEPRTIFNGAKKLPPAHTLTLKRGQAMPLPREYWDVPFTPHGPISKQEAQEELIVRLREAVRIRLVAEVPLGAFLSGGVDSSAVVAMMAGLMDEPVNTCSISFGDPAFNEAAFAQKVADRYHTRHYVEQVESDDYDLIDKLAELYDEPFADSSAIPTYRVCELAKKRVTVALSGDGGDENLAGYRRYRYHLYEERMRSLLPLSIRKPLFGLLGTAYPKADWAPKVFRAKSTFEALARDPVEGYFHSVSVMGDKLRDKLFSSHFKLKLQGHRAVDVMRRHADRAPTDDPLSRVQYLDIKTYLAGDILTKVDRASMAHALEVRVPILDHKLVEWMSGVPSSYKLHGQEGKYIFKKALEPYLPDDILYRPKMGFSVPLASWFRGPLRQRVRDAILGETLASTGIFDMAFLREMVDQHQSGLRDYSASLWTILMFEAFLRKVMGNPSSEGVHA